MATIRKIDPILPSPPPAPSSSLLPVGFINLVAERRSYHFHRAVVATVSGLPPFTAVSPSTLTFLSGVLRLFPYAYRISINVVESCVSLSLTRRCLRQSVPCCLVCAKPSNYSGVALRLDTISLLGLSRLDSSPTSCARRLASHCRAAFCYPVQ
jgi:hypothetical protein